MKAVSTRQILEVDARGLAEVSFSYLSADALPAVGVPPEILVEIQEPIRTMVGLRGSYLTNSCLYADVIEFEQLAALDPRLQEQLADLQSSPGLMSDPFPTEAVGIGAQWRVRWVRVENPFITAYSSGIRLEQEAVYTLVSMDGDRLSLTAEVRHSAAGDEISHPGLPGTLVQMRQMEAEGQYALDIELGSVLPSTVTTEVSSEQVIVLDRGRGEESNHHQLHVRTSLEPLSD